jgi:hypothetical protein
VIFRIILSNRVTPSAFGMYRRFAAKRERGEGNHRGTDARASRLGELLSVGLDRRRILHVHLTKHPTNSWILQQLREAFPLEASQKYLIFDRDQKFGFEVIARLTAPAVRHG